MDWVKDFYSKQYRWTELYNRKDLSIYDYDRRRAEAIERLAGPGTKKVLELGCGGGWTAAAIAELGHKVVAVDIEDASAANARRMAATVSKGEMTVVHDDFYVIKPADTFDVVCYFDGFGIGSDSDQRNLLHKVRGWLKPNGCTLIDVFNPLYWANVAGKRSRLGTVMCQSDFDADGCRLVDWVWPLNEEGSAVSQNLRCYTPADLRLLIEGSGLLLSEYQPYNTHLYEEPAPLFQAMLYLAKLTPQQ